jgi:hypothetical protein
MLLLDGPSPPTDTQFDWAQLDDHGETGHSDAPDPPGSP